MQRLRGHRPRWRFLYNDALPVLRRRWTAMTEGKDPVPKGAGLFLMFPVSCPALSAGIAPVILRSPRFFSPGGVVYTVTEDNSGRQSREE